MVLSCGLWLEEQPNDGNSWELAGYGGENSRRKVQNVVTESTADHLVVKVTNVQTGKVAEMQPTATLLELLASFKPMPKKLGPDGADHSTNANQLEAIARKIAALPEKEIVTIKRLDAAASK